MSSTAAASAGFKDRRAGSQTALQRFVSERSQMLALYWKVAGLSPDEFGERTNAKEGFKAGFKASPKSWSRTTRDLGDFCEVLVDYIAAGHFILYDRISSGKERRQSVADLAKMLYPKIADLTQVAIRFNDKYDTLVMKDKSASQPTGAEPDLETLMTDLSRLGEVLAERIELEDQLIARLMEGR